MAEQIALIETPVYDVTGEPLPRVLHELCAFEVLSTTCRARTNPEGDTLYLGVGKRTFAVSLIELAAGAALSVDQHLRGEIAARIRAAQPPAPSLVEVPLRGTVGGGGRIAFTAPRGVAP